MMSSAQHEQQVSDFRKPVQAVEVIAMDMITPVGADIHQTATSVRAGISAYQVSSVYNKQFNPMTMAMVPEDALPPLAKELNNAIGLTSRQQRMLRLASIPIQELADAASLQQSVPLLLAGPEKLPGCRSIISDKFLKQLKVQTQVPIDLANSYVFPYGRASGLHALEAAMLMVEQGIASQVIVGAVDSYFDLDLLGSLDNDNRILAEGIMDGFAPGEGAAFMLLQAATDKSKVKLYPPGISKEPGHRYSQEPYKGDGLSSAVSEALSILSDNKIKTVLAGFNGENFNAKEWGVAMIRNSQKIEPDFNIIHPADCFGDSGASLGLILVQLGLFGLDNGYYRGPIMAWCSSELSQRAAVCIV